MHIIFKLQEGARRKSAFIFATAKGYTGHQESGAGVAGLMEAALLAQHAAVPRCQLARMTRRAKRVADGSAAAQQPAWQRAVRAAERGAQ